MPLSTLTCGDRWLILEGFEVGADKEAVENSTFDRVVRYFLGHEKPKDEPKAKPKKRPAKTVKKPSTKPKKRA